MRPNTWNPIARYAHWLHLRWPAGKVEALPLVNEDGTTNVPGLFIVGDLAGVPLLKLSANGGARVARRIAETASRSSDPDTLDLAIIGAGASGMAAALEAKKAGLKYAVFESAEPFSTIVNFPKAKPIYLYPTEMALDADLALTDRSDVKEGLLAELTEQTIDRGLQVTHRKISHVERAGGVLQVVSEDGSRTKSRHVIVGIGRSGDYRKLNVPGESLGKVYNRLHDPADYAGTDVLVVGGGDSALETAIALAQSGARVTLSYRKPEFNRPKPENIEQIERLRAQGGLTLEMDSRVLQIGERSVDLQRADGKPVTLPNDHVFTMIGRDAPLSFFRKSGVAIRGEKRIGWWLTLLLMLAVFTFLYQVKKPGTFLPVAEWWEAQKLFPHNLGPILSSISSAFDRPSNLLGTIRLSVAGVEGKTGAAPGFWFSLMYSTLIVVFGIKRIRRRKTPYITVQTSALMAFQVIPLFLLPYILLPWMGHNGWFDAGIGETIASNLFPVAGYDAHGREYWRAFGLILAWPLFIWNVFTGEPMLWWLVISFAQTFVLIPLIIYFWGKGAYCGWVCSCGAMAETLGDTHRHKMPHGPFWNRMNFIGQAFLALAMLLLLFRIIGWIWPDAAAVRWYAGLLGADTRSAYLPALNYVWFVDLFWAGILGFGLYFHFSGRVWCRFACPLAALMHIYHRFSRFAILADKSKCISCNVCTTVCHQGIDVMNFANKGKPMIDPQCVRCSACVQSCPTGVLSFGQVDKQGNAIAQDPAWLAASPVRMQESRPMPLTIKGRAV